MAALREAGLARTALGGLATAASKTTEPGMRDAAHAFSLELRGLTPEALRAVAGGCVTHSPRVMEMLGVPSLAEAAALAGAGPGAILIQARVAIAGEATCALARGLA